MLRDPATQTILAALAVALTLFFFVTGKQKLADFFPPKESAQNGASHAPVIDKKPADSVVGAVAVKSPKALTASERKTLLKAETDFDSLLDLTRRRNLTDLQAEKKNNEADGKDIILAGRLVSAGRFGNSYSAEITSASGTGGTFHLNIAYPDRANWTDLPLGATVMFRATLKQPLIGTIVGDAGTILSVSIKQP